MRGRLRVKRSKAPAIHEVHALELRRLSSRMYYDNVVPWRNECAHEAAVLVTATYAEVRKSYELGKHVLHHTA